MVSQDPFVERAPRDARIKPLAIIALVAVAYWLLQHTGLAPFPHTADDFVGGFAVGTGIATAGLWIRSRR
ncbi:MAG: hypothetical protein M3Z54_07955 [Gemmatimonadota bacterium]|nr:hypothetical protein [Gemmatimonadota bacterium]